MKSHYKLSSKPIGIDSYVVIVSGFRRGEVHRVIMRLDGVVWTLYNNGLEVEQCVFLERIAAWNAPAMLPIQMEYTS